MGQPLPLRLGLWLRPRRAQGQRHALVEEEQGRGTVYLAHPRREGKGCLGFDPACCQELFNPARQDC